MMIKQEERGAGSSQTILEQPVGQRFLTNVRVSDSRGGRVPDPGIRWQAKTATETGRTSARPWLLGHAAAPPAPLSDPIAAGSVWAGQLGARTAWLLGWRGVGQRRQNRVAERSRRVADAIAQRPPLHRAHDRRQHLAQLDRQLSVHFL